MTKIHWIHLCGTTIAGFILGAWIFFCCTQCHEIDHPLGANTQVMEASELASDPSAEEMIDIGDGAIETTYPTIFCGALTVDQDFEVPIPTTPSCWIYTGDDKPTMPLAYFISNKEEKWDGGSLVIKACHECRNVGTETHCKVWKCEPDEVSHYLHCEGEYAK